MFVRYQATGPNRRGMRVGVFALVNGLAARGLLTADQEAFRRRTNDWYNDNLIDPGRLDPGVFDRAVYPVAACWFRSGSARLLERVSGYLDILDTHGLEWERVESEVAPGEILYADADQIVVAVEPEHRETPAACPARA
ncbi:MAG TPA: hypothetical protein VGC18_06835 [Lacisediminihabitans sp.]|uniref:hypothetical protein n=1 Tax=Lacisediminihabitans sp. TaxID=2787631 RepID=UPI002EDB48E0